MRDPWVWIGFGAVVAIAAVFAYVAVVERRISRETEADVTAQIEEVRNA